MVTTRTDSSLAVLACSAMCLVSVRQRDLSPTMRSAAGAGTAMVLAPYAHKRFATAGINTNVWPLGPQEWTSG